MFGIGGSEFVIIALVALFIFGPDRLPGVAKQAARLLRDVRRWTTKARADLTDTLGPEFENFDLADLNPKNFVKKHLIDGLDDLDAEDVLPVPRGSTAASVLGLTSSKPAATTSDASAVVAGEPVVAGTETSAPGRVNTLALTEAADTTGASGSTAAELGSDTADHPPEPVNPRPYIDLDAT